MAIDGTLYSGSRPVLDLRRGSSPITRAVTGVGVGALLNAPTVVFLGDSITEQNGGIAATPSLMHSGFFVHGVAKSGWEVTPVNKGVAGQTTAQMLARLNADVIDLAPRYCHILGGTNDVGLGVSTATTIANIDSMISQLQAAGISVAIGTVIPRGSPTTDQLNAIATINAHIRALSVPVIDYHAALDDGAGLPVAGTLSDGVHPNRLGASRMGHRLAQWLSTLRTLTYPLITDAGVSATQLLDYGRFQAGATGTLPTGWSQIVTGTATYGREARTDAAGGNWLTVQLDAGEALGLTSNVNVGTSVLVGDTVAAEVEYTVTPIGSTNTHAVGLVLQFWNGSSFFSNISCLRYDGSQPYEIDTPHSGVLRTPNVVVPSGTTIAQISLQCQGGGTFKLDRAAVRKIS